MPLLSTTALELCRRAGLQDSQVDVTALTGTIDGIATANRSPVRATLEHIIRAFGIVVCKTDGKIVFRLRQDITLAATIDESELVPFDGGAAIKTTRRQSSELNTVVDVVYLNKDYTYQQATQTAKRQISSQDNPASYVIPIVMRSDTAKGIADRLLDEMWANNYTYQFTVPFKYMDLEPGDYVAVVTKSATYHVLIETTSFDGSKMVCNASTFVPSVFHQSNVGWSPIDNTTIPTIGDTIVHLLDIPIWRAAHNDPGFYVAVSRTGSPWSGCAVYRSSDDVSFAVLDENNLWTVWGYSNTATGNVSDPWVIDWQNTFDVTVKEGQLYSTTKIGLYNGANSILVGNEILQFLNAQLVSANRYRLSGLVRGRLGTDWAISSHTTGEKFVLLNQNLIHRIADSSSLINVLRYYKGVSYGKSLSDVSSVQFKNTGKGLLPYSPVHIKGARDGSGNVTITWKRRTRIPGVRRDFYDQPIGEQAEQYTIKIMNGSVVVRTLTSTTPSVVYTAADQVTDWGATQSSVTLRISQISADVGEGTEREGTV